MNKLNHALLFVLAPLVYGSGYIRGVLTVYYHHFFGKPEIKFKPFWIETNLIFGAVETLEDFKQIKKEFKKSYPRIDINELQISIDDFNMGAKKPNDDTRLPSFGLRAEHIHSHNYVLSDWFNDAR